MNTPGMSTKVDKKNGDPTVKKTPDTDSNEENDNEDGNCAFCGTAEDNERNFGKVIQKCGVTAHYFCMLFSSALNQRGKNEKQGIQGFLVDDVKRELRRGAKLKCFYCKKAGATIGCAVRKCGKKFHLHCGLKHETLNQFFGSFCVFCADHRPKQKFGTSPSDQAACNGAVNTNCPICLCSVEAKICYHSLRAPCCKNEWFHRLCVQDQALNAGYFFKCPLCNNKDLYESEMLTQGIYIPEQDASWEMDPNAFQDLLHRHDQCDLPVCACPDGRMHDIDGGRWEIILCAICGHQGCHIACGRLSFYKPYWECSMCQGILSTKKLTKPKKARKRKSKEVEASSPESLVLDSATFSEVPHAWTSSQIMERIWQCRSELQSNFRLLENLSSSDESLANHKPESTFSFVLSSIASPSTGSTSTASEQKSAYISDSDDEFDVVVLKDPAEGGASSGSDIDIVGDVKLRLSPSDFPSPYVQRLAIHKAKKHRGANSIEKSEQDLPEMDDDLPSTQSPIPQITCYVVRETSDSDDGNPADMEALEEGAGISKNMLVCEAQFDRLNWREESPGAMLECQLRSNAERLENASDSSTDFVMDELELGGLISCLDHSIKRDDDAGDDSVVCLTEDRSTKLGEQVFEIGDSSQEYYPLETSKENQSNGIVQKKAKKSKKKKKKRDESRNEENKVKQKQDGGAEDCRKKKQMIKQSKMQRYLTSLELGGGNKLPECQDSSGINLEALMEMVDKHENKPSFDGLPLSLDSSGEAEGIKPLMSSDSCEMVTDTESNVEVIDLL